MLQIKEVMTQEEVDAYCESVPYNPMGFNGKRKLVHGIGINDFPHIVQFVDGSGKKRHHSGYGDWTGLLERGYCPKLKSKHGSYKDVTVCAEWHSASVFNEWQKKQRKEKGWNLDKDLLVANNKVYSPDTCIYVPQWLNKFIINSAKSRGKYLIGVIWEKSASKFRAFCQNPFTRKQDHLGLFMSEMEAHLAWRKRKLEHALALKPQMDEIDVRIYPNVVTIINTAK